MFFPVGTDRPARRRPAALDRPGHSRPDVSGQGCPRRIASPDPSHGHKFVFVFQHKNRLEIAAKPVAALCLCLCLCLGEIRSGAASAILARGTRPWPAFFIASLRECVPHLPRARVALHAALHRPPCACGVPPHPSRRFAAAATARRAVAGRLRVDVWHPALRDPSQGPGAHSICMGP